MSGALRRSASLGRAVPLALGAVALAGGLWGALLLLGFPQAAPPVQLAVNHGPLMALGFLGTLIALERAVALGRPWGYGAPISAGLGAAAIVTGMPEGVGQTLLGLAAVLLLAVYLVLFRAEPLLHVGTQALGAAAWVGAALLWLDGLDIDALVPWLAAFLVLTVVGERLELSRLARRTSRARRAFILLVMTIVLGTIVSTVSLDLGTRLAGLGFVGTALWLGGNDVARRTVRVAGVTRFIAVCLLSGFAWLGLSGLIWALSGAAGGSAYDARIHAVFLGFVISMVFGHAMVILPAVLRVALPYRPRFYGHLALLQVGLLLRLGAGDLLGSQAGWQLGGLLNELALLTFVGSSAMAAVTARRSLARRPQPSRAAAAQELGDAADGSPEPGTARATWGVRT